MMALSKTMTGERLPTEVAESDLVQQALEAICKHLGMEAAFAHETGAMVIAEGIETVREKRTLEALGVEMGQDYLLGYPCELPDADGMAA